MQNKEQLDAINRVAENRTHARRAAVLRSACSDLNSALMGLWAENEEDMWADLIVRLFQVQGQALHALDYQLGKIIEDEDHDIPF